MFKYWNMTHSFLGKCFLFILLLVTIASCDEEEPIPAYVQINEVTVLEEDPEYGSNTEKVTDVWVSADEVFLGVFELPASVPVLKTGETNILVYPGVKQGGIHSDRRIYPFYSASSQTVSLEPNQDASVSPVFSYNEVNTRVLLNADFELASEFEVVTDGAQLVLNTNNSKVLEGSTSAEAIPSAADSTWRIETIDLWEIDLSRSTWLEFNYKITEPTELIIFVKGQNETTTEVITLPFIYLVITPQDDWNKMYVEISELLVEGVGQFGSTATNFAFNFSFQGKASDPATAEYLFDNIKLITSN